MPSSSSSERNSGGGMTIDIRPMIEDVSQVMTKHITSILSGVIGEYTIYKETHDTIMGLPCVRKLQERIAELEQDGSGCASASMSASRSGSREEEVAQLQSAIADLNRYIHALESKVNMKQVSSGDGGHNQQNHHPDEESVRLEIHETDDGDEGDEGDCDEHCDSTVETSSHKNVIITSEAVEEAEEAQPEEEDAEADAEDAEADAEAAEQEEAEAQPEKEEDAEQEDEEAEQEEDAEEEDAEEEAQPEQPEEEEAEAEEEEEAEAEAQPEQLEPEPEEEETEETEEVEEVKIKGKTYFTTNPQNGIIYACVDDDVGDEVGVFKNGVAVFNKGKK